MLMFNDPYERIGIEFVPQDPTWVLNSIAKELWDAQDIIRRYENGEFDYMPEENKAWVGSARYYRGVLRDVTERIALLKMSPMDRFVDQVTKNHEAQERYHAKLPDLLIEENAELYPDGDPADKYVWEAYVALNKDDELAAWTAIVQMNEEVDEHCQPNTLYLPNKKFWPELRLSNEVDRTIDSPREQQK